MAAEAVAAVEIAAADVAALAKALVVAVAEMVAEAAVEIAPDADLAAATEVVAVNASAFLKPVRLSRYNFDSHSGESFGIVAP